MPPENGKRFHKWAVVMIWLAAIFGVLGLGCQSLAWLSGGEWVRGHGTEDYNRQIAIFFVLVPLILSGLCAAVSVALFRKNWAATKKAENASLSDHASRFS